MIAVRYRRRYLLCQVLTIIGVIFLLALGSYSYLDNNPVLGSILTGNALLGLLNLYLLKRSGNVERAARILSIILLMLSFSLLVEHVDASVQVEFAFLVDETGDAFSSRYTLNLR